MKTKTQHTPGPLYVTNISGYLQLSNNEALQYISVTNNDKISGDTVIVAICPYSDLHEGSKATASANANLIAAAPEMLEALKMALDLLEENMGESRWYLRKHYNQISGAINKATGQ